MLTVLDVAMLGCRPTFLFGKDEASFCPVISSNFAQPPHAWPVPPNPPLRTKALLCRQLLPVCLMSFYSILRAVPRSKAVPWSAHMNPNNPLPTRWFFLVGTLKFR